MTGIVAVPHLEMSRVIVPGIVTVPAELATIGCHPRCKMDNFCPVPARLQDIPFDGMSLLRAELERMGKMMIGRLRPRGYEWLGELRFHGPFWSREFNTRMTDLARSEWRLTEPWANRDGERHLEHSLGFVSDVDAWSPYMDYVLVGAFLKRNERFDEPVEVSV